MRSRNFHARERVFSEAARVASERSGADPLCVDLGVGTGYLTRTFASRGFRVTGCDTSEEMLKVAAVEVPDADLHHADVVAFLRRQPRDSADFVACSSVLEYLPDPLAVIREAAPVLKPDAILAVSLPQRASVSRLMQQFLMLRVPRDQRYSSQWRNRITDRDLVVEGRCVGLRLMYREFFGAFEWRGRRLPFEKHRPVATLALHVFERHS